MTNPIGFDVFMERALYGPDGFYASGSGPGRREADFITSPEIGSLFGAVVANALDEWWDALGHPSPFPVVEGGAGRGALRDAVIAASPRCLDALQYVTVDRAASADLDDLPAPGSLGEVGVVIANELLDNLVFKIVERADDGWREVLVDPANKAFSLSETMVPRHTQAIDWVARAKGLFARSHIALIDYGVRTTEELLGRSWLRTYRDHGRGFNPLAKPGEHDITCDVDFSQLAPDSITTQADWLRAHGIDALVEDARATWQERAAIGDLDALKARSRVHEADLLLDPEGPGGFLVAEWRVSRA